MADSGERERHQAEEKLQDLFEPDLLLPQQYFAALQRKRFPNGEHRLLIAVMRDAIECFQKHIHAHDAKRRQLFVEAEAWIGNEEDRSAFSFINVCDTLGMNPDYVRTGLLQWRDDQTRSRGRRAKVNSRKPDMVRIDSRLARIDTELATANQGS